MPFFCKGNNRVQNDKAQHDEYLLDYYQVARCAANQAIYLVISHWVVGSLYLNWYINFTTIDRRRFFRREE